MTSRGKRLASSAWVLAAVLLGTVSAAGGASAAGPGALTSVVNANAPERARGTNFDAVQLTAPAACDPAATRHLTRIVSVQPASASDSAAAKKWVGDNLYATSPVGLPGPLTVRSNGSWQQLADAYGQVLVPGVYRLELRCQDALGTEIFQRWRGDLTFRSATSWTGFVAAAAQKSTSASAKPSSGTASPDPSAATGTADPTPTDSATPTESSTYAAAATVGDSDDGDGLASTGAQVVGIALLGLVLVLGGGWLAVLARRRGPGRPTRVTRP